MHIVQLSHLIFHACVWHAHCTAITLHFACLFFQHVTPSQGPLLPPSAPHLGGRAPGECQHRVCTHAAAHGEVQVILSQLIMRDSFSDTSPSLENIGMSTHDAPYMHLPVTDIVMPPLRQGQLCVRGGHAESGMHRHPKRSCSRLQACEVFFFSFSCFCVSLLLFQLQIFWIYYLFIVFMLS